MAANNGPSEGTRCYICELNSTDDHLELGRFDQPIRSTSLATITALTHSTPKSDSTQHIYDFEDMVPFLDFATVLCPHVEDHCNDGILSLAEDASTNTDGTASSRPQPGRIETTTSCQKMQSIAAQPPRD